LCRTYGLDTWVPLTASSLGLAYAFTGRHNEGVELVQDAIRRGKEARLTHYEPVRMNFLANTYLLAGRHDDALATAQDTLKLARRYRERGPEAWALYLIAVSMAQAQPGERSEIRDNYLAAQDLAEELGMRPLVAHCHIGLGKLDTVFGDKETARNELQSALSMYRDMDMQFYLKQAETELKAID
jgi:tetratricopeptide (TPR) repeat protein